MFDPIDNAPEARVSVPATVTLPHIEVVLLIVRLFNDTAGKLAVPDPPIVKFDELPPVKVPQSTCPFNVSVLAPIARPAPAGLKVPLTVRVL